MNSTNRVRLGAAEDSGMLEHDAELSFAQLNKYSDIKLERKKTEREREREEQREELSILPTWTGLPGTRHVFMSSCLHVRPEHTLAEITSALCQDRQSFQLGHSSPEAVSTLRRHATLMVDAC
ncbi:hypothetical protein LDENG_00029650 [Lucifuga dentata]|nr:hypothetical protein LDENG_00029650 [Lucifuga dentata]